MILQKVQLTLRRVPEILKQCTVEPYAFFLMFGYLARLVSMQSMLIERACIISLNYTKEVCMDLENNKEAEVPSVQLGNNLYLGTMVIATLPAFVASAFLGSWSDIYGRRYTMILATTGLVINGILVAIVTSIESAPPYMFLVVEIPSGIFGGMLVCLSSSYSYMSDITNEKTRPTRYALLEFAVIMSMPLGTVIGGNVYTAGGYVAVMILSLCGFACGLAWAILLLKETVVSKEVHSKMEIFKDLFKLDNLIASFRTCTKQRPGNLRTQLWLLVLVSCSIRLVNIGKIGIGYSFGRQMFGWGVEHYSNTVTLFYVIDGVATLTIVPIITGKLMLHEAAVGLIGVLSLMAKLILFAVSFKEEIFYYAMCSGVLNPCSNIATRSRISKLVSKQELGRVFSLLATCESLTPVIGTFIMTQIYNASVSVYPGLVFGISSVLLIPSIIIFGWMTKLPTVSFAAYCESEENRFMRELNDVSAF